VYGTSQLGGDKELGSVSETLPGAAAEIKADVGKILEGHRERNPGVPVSDGSHEKLNALTRADLVT